jgi:uncharacterized protein (DUF983 family)
MAYGPSPIVTGLACKCPACGKGRLFDGYLTVVERCEVCGAELRSRSSGDGPAVFVIFALGVVLSVLAWIVEATFSPPAWVHAVVWSVAVVAGTLALLRPFKGVVVALEYRHGTPDQ